MNVGICKRVGFYLTIRLSLYANRVPSGCGR